MNHDDIVRILKEHGYDVRDSYRDEVIDVEKHKPKYSRIILFDLDIRAMTLETLRKIIESRR